MKYESSGITRVIKVVRRHPERSRFSGGAKDLARATLRLLAMAAILAIPSLLAAQDLPLFRWENFTVANGLPDNHVFCVLVDGNRVWAGTENGLGLYEDGAWKVFRPAEDSKQQSLAHQAVLSLALDKRTGDLWAGTMGGLSRVSAGRIDTFTQLTSGLSNDIVYGVGVQGDFVWTATAAGASRLNTRTGEWALFNERNTPMQEIWTYAVSPADDKVYYAEAVCSSTTSRPRAGKTTTIPMAKQNWC
jgi:hypothetical protein